MVRACGRMVHRWCVRVAVWFIDGACVRAVVWCIDGACVRSYGFIDSVCVPVVSLSLASGDHIEFVLVGAAGDIKLIERVNGKVVLDPVNWVRWNTDRQRLSDKGGGIPVPQGAAIAERVAALALNTTLVQCKWQGDPVVARSRLTIARALGRGQCAGKVYCGQYVGTLALPGSDGHCGPTNGPQVWPLYQCCVTQPLCGFGDLCVIHWLLWRVLCCGRGFIHGCSSMAVHLWLFIHGCLFMAVYSWLCSVINVQLLLKRLR